MGGSPAPHEHLFAGVIGGIDQPRPPAFKASIFGAFLRIEASVTARAHGDCGRGHAGTMAGAASCLPLPAGSGAGGFSGPLWSLCVAVHSSGDTRMS